MTSKTKKKSKVITMSEFEDIPSREELGGTPDKFYVSPHHYLVDAVGQDPVEMAPPRYEYGKTTLDDRLFVCPQCGSQKDAEIYAIVGTKVGDPRATIFCQECDWSVTQNFVGDPNDAD